MNRLKGLLAGIKRVSITPLWKKYGQMKKKKKRPESTAGRASISDRSPQRGLEYAPRASEGMRRGKAATFGREEWDGITAEQWKKLTPDQREEAAQREAQIEFDVLKGVRKRFEEWQNKRGARKPKSLEDQTMPYDPRHGGWKGFDSPAYEASTKPKRKKLRRGRPQKKRLQSLFSRIA